MKRNPTNKTASGNGAPVSRAKRRPARRGILRRLGLVGMDHIEPVILAAIATERPLLLIGKHGTAKSHLLTKLSEALGLSCRHYNASLLNYDDLVGYPLPDGDGNLRFVQTPASIWGAEVVFLDELSRCRPDMQNRLFSIIHEKRVQGMPLDRLVHRWAAMNPASAEDADIGEPDYSGSEPLDAALADRFSFVVEVPAWDMLSDHDKEALIRLRDEPVADQDARDLVSLISAIHHETPLVEATYGSAVTEYVRMLFDHTRQMGLYLSSRRAAMLYHNIITVHAARLVLAPTAMVSESAWLAVEHSMPQRAEGVAVDRTRLLIAHKEAWVTANMDKVDPRKIINAEPDPVRRAVKATSVAALTTQALSAYVADGLAHAEIGARHALAVHVIRSPATPKLNAAVAEQVAELYAMTVIGKRTDEEVTVPRNDAWEPIMMILGSFSTGDAEGTLVANLLTALFKEGEIKSDTDAQRVLERWATTRLMCRDDSTDTPESDLSRDTLMRLCMPDIAQGVNACP